jgi:large subunit ribosomal protein L35
MPKIKSHSGIKKRFKRTASGKWIFKRPGRRHILAGEPAAQNRQKRRSASVTKTQARILDTYVPYA